MVCFVVSASGSVVEGFLVLEYLGRSVLSGGRVFENLLLLLLLLLILCVGVILAFSLLSLLPLSPDPSSPEPMWI